MTPLVIVLVCLIAAQAMADETDLRIDKALKASGIDGQLEHLGQAILSTIPEDAFEDKKSKAGAAAFLKKTAGQDVLLSVVHSEVRASLHGDALEQVTHFFDSKVGKKVGRAQQSALESSVLKRVREGRSHFLTLKEPRIELLKRIIRAQRVSEGNERFLSTVIRGLVDGSSTAGPQAAHAEETRRKISLIEKEIHAEEKSTSRNSAHILRPPVTYFGQQGARRTRVVRKNPSLQPSFVARYNEVSSSRCTRCAKALGEYSVKPRPSPPKKTSRSPGERIRERDRDKEDDGPWGFESP